MSAWRISAQQERWLALNGLFSAQHKTEFFAQHIGDWHSASFIARCAFFVLGMVVGTTLYTICELFHLQEARLIAGMSLVVAAEWLILSRRLAFAGIEEALELGGLLLIAFEWLDGFERSTDVALALTAASAFGVAGLRLLNPLFTMLAILALTVAVDLTIGKSSAHPHAAELWTGLLSYAIAWLALGLGAIRFQRPSYDRMLDWCVVVMSLAGYLWLASRSGLEPPDYLTVREPMAWLTLLLPSAFGITALLIGLRRRSHGPLIAVMICIACLAIELRKLTGLSLQARLILWGCIALVAAVLLERYLRRPRAGITSQKLGDSEGALSLLEIAGAATLTPPVLAAPADGVAPGEGRFGGGGASGSY